MDKRCLTVRQPWASLIAAGDKTIEIRSRPTHYRGQLIITASANPWPGKPTGCIICTVDLIECRAMGPGDLAKACCQPYDGWLDCYAWVLANPAPLPPVPIKGRLGIWRLPPVYFFLF
ncbi:MAG: ASCH domain-containing protein [Desulfobulbus sp.]|nr:ASCH domain-containing protein [Desulfobulbus sp.]